MTELQEPQDWNACLRLIATHQDQAAFARLFRHFAPRIKAYLIRCGGSPSQAEEATQEAMATVWRKAGMFDPAKAGAATWIFRVARNKQLDSIRRQKRPEPEDLPWGETDSSDPAAEIAVAQEEDALRKAVSSLPEKQRVVIEQAFFADLSHSEIAELTKLPLGTIKSRIRLAIDRLRGQLDTDLR